MEEKIPPLSSHAIYHFISLWLRFGLIAGLLFAFPWVANYLYSLR